MQAEAEPQAGAAGPLAIVYQDAWLVAVHKPSGMVVHRSSRVRSGPALLQVLRDQLGRLVYPVHRLDRSASGLMVVALDPETARRLCEQFREQSVAKTYLAVVRGWPAATGELDYPVPTADGHARSPARTSYRRLATVELPLACGPYATSRYALMALRPQGGRYHQLRRHLKHLSHPIIGDTEYGDSRHNRLFRSHFRSHRLLLQAVRLELEHPWRGAPMTWRCAPEAELLQAFAGRPGQGMLG